ncbi:uncharacterized protein LOC129602552, partial [Paramacrobiotus metropolitanus]|uniref:uncharacterized protein LOC129602552 n=1 Tax=Paramacrobiotus metropolitanus TaxID=2943436 RepID=UPI0024463685
MVEKGRYAFAATSITFLSEFIVEQITILNGRLQGTADDCQNGNDPDCLHFSSVQFNGLFVAHFWAGGTAALLTGFFVGRFGVWIASIVSSVFLLVGMLLITIGPYSMSNDAAFALLLTGRIVYAIGYFGNITLSHEVKSHWFLGKELALAFALYMTMCRIGSVLTF